MQSAPVLCSVLAPSRALLARNHPYWRVMVFPAVRRRAEGWDTSPEEAALVEEVSAPARGIASLAWLRPFTSLLQLDLRHNRLCCLDGI